jgi:hypothetical protein
MAQLLPAANIRICIKLHTTVNVHHAYLGTLLAGSGLEKPWQILLELSHAGPPTCMECITGILEKHGFKMK